MGGEFRRQERQLVLLAKEPDCIVRKRQERPVRAERQNTTASDRRARIDRMESGIADRRPLTESRSETSGFALRARPSDIKVMTGLH
jgi:hypothetical protein